MSTDTDAIVNAEITVESKSATDLAKIIDKIRKALALAEDAAKRGSQAEADLANEVAAKLTARHSIDSAMLAESGVVEDVIINKRILITENYTIDKRNLLWAIAKGLGAEAIFLTTRRSGTRQSYSHRVHVFAYQSDMERIEFLFELLQTQMLLGAAAAHIPSYENKRSYRKSWMEGFAAAIRTRLERNIRETAAAQTAEAQAKNEFFSDRKAIEGQDDFDLDLDDFDGPAEPSAALVLSTRKERVRDDYKKAYPKVRTINRTLNGSGWSGGYRAGSTASLGGNHVGNGSRKSLAG